MDFLREMDFDSFTWAKKIDVKKRFSKIKISRSRLVNKEKIKIKENSNDGILGLGWSHPNYGRSIGVSGVWSEGYFSSFIFRLQDTKIETINIF